MYLTNMYIMSTENSNECDIDFTIENIVIDGIESQKFKCNFCDFTNSHQGGMKRHIQANHKPRGTKRPAKQNEDAVDDEKRPKLDDFEPDLASTIIDDGRDDLEEVLLAEENEVGEVNSTVAGYSNDYLERLGDLTAYNFEDVVNDRSEKKIEETNGDSAMDIANVEISKDIIQKLEMKLKEKDLVIAEKELRIENLSNEVDSNKEEIVRLNDDVKAKDDALEVNLCHATSLETKIEAADTKFKTYAEKSEKRIKLLERALGKYINKVKSSSDH